MEEREEQRKSHETKDPVNMTYYANNEILDKAWENNRGVQPQGRFGNNWLVSRTNMLGQT